MMGKEVDKNVLVVSVLGIVAVFGVLAVLNGGTTAMASREGGMNSNYDMCMNMFADDYEGEELSTYCDCKVNERRRTSECQNRIAAMGAGGVANGVSTGSGGYNRPPQQLKRAEGIKKVGN